MSFDLFGESFLVKGGSAYVQIAAADPGSALYPLSPEKKNETRPAQALGRAGKE